MMKPAFFNNPRPALLAGAGLLLLLGLPQTSAAACKVGFSAPMLDVGNTVYNAGPDADVPGYRQIGNPRVGVLTVICDADRTALQLTFGNISGLNQKLLKWDAAQPAGALQMRILRATADGVAVNMMAADHLLVPALDIVRDGDVLTLDLTPLPKGARAFMLELQVKGLVDKHFVPTSRTSFSLTPRVQLLDP